MAGGQLEEITYEGYAAAGVALVIKVLTDNKNRAASEIRHIFTKFGTNLAVQGAVARSFKRKGQILVETSTVEEDKLMDIVLNAGAEDMQDDGGVYDIVTEPAAFQSVVDALEKAKIKTASAEITLIADNYITINDKAMAANVLKFVEALEDNDDVQDGYSNMDIDDKILKELEQK